jgi:hypothetical protein
MIPYFEILEFGNVKKRFQLSLSNISMSNEMMSTPTIDIDGVAELLPYLRGRKEIRIYTENAIFYSNTQSVNVNTNTGVLSISCSHVIKEWEYRQVPTNYATKDKTIPQIYEDDEMKYSNEWIMSFDEKASQEVIDYVYSRQDKLSALTRTCELTPDLFWRVPLTKDKRIEVGVFGEKKNYTVSLRPSGKNNIHILEEPEINEDWSNVINLATVYANKSDSGMSSLSLREVYNDTSLQDPNFPVVIIRNNINNERDYNYIDYPKLAPNNQLEYAVIDTESVAMESGLFIEGTFAFDDLNPFSLEEDVEDGEEPVGSGNWSPQAFIDEYNGQSIDMDGVPPEQPYQCVDTFKKCLEIIGYPNPSRAIGGDGYAWNIWFNRQSLGYDAYFDYPSTPQFGDWAIFNKAGDTPYSHVAMFVSDNGNGTAQFFGQNQPQPYCTVTSISTANILGWLRVKPEFWQGTYNPESGNGVKNITDEDRIKCAKAVYDATIKKLVNARRKFQIQVKTEQLPKDLNVGDKIRFIYDMDIFHIEECTNYMRKLIEEDDWYYIVKMERNINADGTTTGELTLEKFLRVDREGKQES